MKAHVFLCVNDDGVFECQRSTYPKIGEDETFEYFWDGVHIEKNPFDTTIEGNVHNTIYARYKNKKLYKQNAVHVVQQNVPEEVYIWYCAHVLGG